MTLYKRILLSVLLVIPFSVLANPAADQLSNLLGHYTTYQANFTEETLDAAHRVVQRDHGTLYLKRPDQFRWETNNPGNEVIIANGETLTVYEVDLQQMTIQNIKNTQMENPAALLSGDVDRLLRGYTVSTVEVNGHLWYRLTPKAGRSGFNAVYLFFKDGVLHALEVRNTLNQTSNYLFTAIKVNLHLQNALFHLTPPKGVDVIKQ